MESRGSGPTLPPDVVPDARALRGLAHPLRVRLLGLLRVDGPSTATKLAERTGVSSAAASYHLRSLGFHGFVVEDDGPPDKHGRERWWRAAHRTTRVEDLPSDPEQVGVLVEYLRAVARSHSQRVDGWLDAMTSAPPQWQQPATLSNATLRLTPAQAQQLNDRLDALFGEYPRHEPGEDGPPESERVAVQWHLLPELRDEG